MNKAQTKRSENHWEFLQLLAFVCLLKFAFVCLTSQIYLQLISRGKKLNNWIILSSGWHDAWQCHANTLVSSNMLGNLFLKGQGKIWKPGARFWEVLMIWQKFLLIKTTYHFMH